MPCDTFLLVFGVAPLVAVVTDLWFAAPMHFKHGLIEWQEVGQPDCFGAEPAVKLHSVDETAVNLLKYVIAAAVVLTTMVMMFQKLLHALGRELRITNGQSFKASQGGD